MVPSFYKTSIFLIAVFVAQFANAVMPPSYYEEREDKSQIKAVAIVRHITPLRVSKGSTLYKAIFSLEKAFESNVPSEFSGTFHSMSEGAEPIAGGIIYYYPVEFQRVYVAISEDGGAITRLDEIKDDVDDFPCNVMNYLKHSY